jgi:uncharacterized protein involved in outer membrane biogenesis
MIRLLAYLGLAALLVAAAGWAVISFVPADAYRGTIEMAVRERSGWRLSWGEMRFAVAPELGIEMDDVVLTPPGDGAPPVTAKRAVLGISLLPLAAGQVEVSAVRLDGAVVSLRRSADGRIVAGDGGAMADPFAVLAFGDLSLSDSRLVLTGERPGEIALPRLRLTWAPEAAALNLTGTIDSGGGPLEVEAVIAQRAALFAGGPFDLNIGFDGKLAKGSADGALDMTAGTFDGALSISASSARRLAAAFGVMLPGDRALGMVSVAAEARIRPGEMRLSDAKFTLDGMTGSGVLAMTMTGPRPYFTAKLAVDRFELGPYVSLTEPGEEGDETGQVEWSEAALNLDGLNAFDADLTVRARRATVGTLRFADPEFTGTVKDGRASLVLSKATLYAGLAAGRLTADVTGGDPIIAVALSLSGFDAQTFLSDAVDSEALTGRGDLTLSLSARGTSRKAMIRTLTGALTLKLIDGGLDGVDLAAVARSVAEETGPDGATVDDATGFVSLAADLTIAAGVAEAARLMIVTPRMTLEGAGVFDLPARTLWLRVEPETTGNAEGADPRLVMPFAISGRWDAPIYQPDWEALRNLVDIGEVSVDELALLPEPARSWFVAAIAAGDSLPGLPAMPMVRAAGP